MVRLCVCSKRSGFMCDIASKLDIAYVVKLFNFYEHYAAVKAYT